MVQPKMRKMMIPVEHTAVVSNMANQYGTLDSFFSANAKLMPQAKYCTKTKPNDNRNVT